MFGEWVSEQGLSSIKISSTFLNRPSKSKYIFLIFQNGGLEGINKPKDKLTFTFSPLFIEPYTLLLSSFTFPKKFLFQCFLVPDPPKDGRLPKFLQNIETLILKPEKQK